MNTPQPASSSSAPASAARKRSQPSPSPSPTRPASPPPKPQPSLLYQTTVRVPFPSADLASIAARVLTVDKPLKPHEAYATYKVVDGNVFEMVVHANSIRMLRTTVNANLEQLVSVTNTMAELAPPGMV
ncbi:hypothetical protein BCR44DRAFT_27349 [Catenaria anguillulae PL171]|uniref:Transcription factor Pcc1-domain-containing protein n=1 Tax=Catenaria anguillulae PL171 TaxID=765915 RepID=A0A1Y2HFP6_9FUNG|nr:hypothetical protein BCR44DRAFT_27349 [Catenaria anguillulae PL171]